MAWLPTPNQDQSAPPAEPVPQGDMWGTMKQIMSQVPTNAMDPMPLAYVPSAPSFISKLAQGFKGGQMLLPEEIKSSRDLMAAGMQPLQNRKHQALIGPYGDVFRSPKTHAETLLDVMNSKNDAYQKIPLHQYLFNREYDIMPHGLGDYKMIRSTGEFTPRVGGAEIPLNATEDSLRAMSELIAKGDTLITDYKVPMRGTKSTNTGPFREFLSMNDVSLRKNFTDFDSKKFLKYSQDLNQRVLELYPEFQKWVASKDEGSRSLQMVMDAMKKSKAVGR